MCVVHSHTTILILQQMYFIALPVISTRRERFPSLTTWASVTISTVAATTIPRRNISGTIYSHIVITNEELRARYDKFASGLNRTEVSVMGMVATMAGYEHGADWLSHVLEVIQDNYNYVKDVLSRELPGVVVCDMEGTYLPMLDLRVYVDPEKTREVVQRRCRLAVDYGEWFGEAYEGFIRMNLATDPAYVKRAIRNLIDELKH